MRYQVWLPDDASAYLFEDYEFAQEFAKLYGGYVVDLKEKVI